MGAVEGEAVACVDDAEEVARLCFKADFPITHDGQHPGEIDETGLYRLEELQWKDFHVPERGGFSVQRMSLFTQGDARKILNDRIRRKTEAGKRTDGYDLEGVVTAEAGEIRQIRDAEGDSAFVVTPAPLADNPAHAAIRASGKYDSGFFLKYRRALQEVFGQLRPLEALSEGN